MLIKECPQCQWLMAHRRLVCQSKNCMYTSTPHVYMWGAKYPLPIAVNSILRGFQCVLIPVHNVVELHQSYVPNASAEFKEIFWKALPVGEKLRGIIEKQVWHLSICVTFSHGNLHC
jgi:hypothetical protein